MKKHSKVLLWGILFIILCLTLFYVIKISVRLYSDNLRADLGERAVQLMYQYSDNYELDKHQEELKNITTEDVYNGVAFDNEERTLYTYLKFKGNSVSINIQRKTPNYIIYTLDTSTIDPNRVFVFFFDVNREGKISYIREMEGLDFVKTNY